MYKVDKVVSLFKKRNQHVTIEYDAPIATFGIDVKVLVSILTTPPYDHMPAATLVFTLT